MKKFNIVFVLLIVFALVFNFSSMLSKAIASTVKTTVSSTKTPTKMPAPSKTPTKAPTKKPTKTPTPAPTPTISPTKSIAWAFEPSVDHKTPKIPTQTKELFKKYGAYYVNNTKSKVVYLTFDLGYENGYTTKILDVLKKHKIKAAFFICKGVISKNPDGIKRMVKEGHIVANHTVNHLNLATLKESKIKSELEGVSKAYKKLTGKEMVKIVRPPSGNYSENSLATLKKLGYTPVFWSLSLHNDWNMKKQPSKAEALALFPEYSHNGAIILLHAVSPTVANNLDTMLTQLEKQGYAFRSILDLK